MRTGLYTVISIHASYIVYEVDIVPVIGRNLQARVQAAGHHLYRVRAPAVVHLISLVHVLILLSHQ